MNQTVDVKAVGLYTHPNPLDLPAGALITADNVVIDRESIAELRRGFKNKAASLTNLHKIFPYAGEFVAHYGSKLAYSTDEFATSTDYTGTYVPPTGADFIRAEDKQGNLYLTTSAGIKKLDAITGTPTNAGVPKGLDVVGSTTGASGFMTTNTQVAYRVVWTFTDANKNLILGAPSQRAVVSNTSGGDRNVSLTLTIPTGITTSHVYQVYRSVMSATSTTEPSDELQFAFQASPTSGEVTAGTITVTDTIAESLLDTSLYTNSSQQGINQANERPPLALDIAEFRGMIFFANTVSRHRLELQLLRIGGSDGLALNDTIIIAGTTYTAKAAETIASGEFKLFTGGVTASDIENTVLSLVRVINRYTTNTLVYAYYADGAPGDFLIEERAIGGSSFAVTSSRTNAWTPVLPTSGTSVSSDNEALVNRVYVSKPDEPEHVPILNNFFVGVGRIHRIVALRDALMVLSDNGIFRVIGTDPTNLDLNLVDGTKVILAPESAVARDNAVIFMSYESVVAASDTGAVTISRPIERTLLQLIPYDVFRTTTFGINYNSDRKYILFCVTTSVDTFPTQAFVYNSMTNSWTRWVMERSCGVVNPANDKLYLGSADTTRPYVYEERKSFTVLDYADDELAVTITSSSNLTVSLVSTAGINVGDTLAQSSFTKSVITEIVSATDVTVTDLQTWTAGAATVYTPYEANIRWAPVHAGNPGLMKHFSEAAWFFANADFNTITVGFRNNFSGSVENVDVHPVRVGSWGLFEWGNEVWGGGSTILQPIRTYIPLKKTRGHWLDMEITHDQALSSFAVAGVSHMFRWLKNRMR